MNAVQFGYVSDGFLGWEANLGVDWKLLESFTLNMRYAYWQPGEWFKEAYQAWTFDAGGNPIANAVLGERDAIHAVRGALVIDF